MDFLRKNAILNLEIDALVLQKKGEIKSGRYEN